MPVLDDDMSGELASVVGLLGVDNGGTGANLSAGLGILQQRTAGGAVVAGDLLAGSSVTAFKPSGVIAVSVDSVATGANTTLTTLWAVSLLASTLTSVGDFLRINASGSFAANGNTKTVTFAFGAATFTINQTTSAPNGVFWETNIHIDRVSATSQNITIAARVGAVAQALQFNTASETLASPIAVTFSGQNGTASAGDILFRRGHIELCP